MDLKEISDKGLISRVYLWRNYNDEELKLLLEEIRGRGLEKDDEVIEFIIQIENKIHKIGIIETKVEKTIAEVERYEGIAWRRFFAKKMDLLLLSILINLPLPILAAQSEYITKHAFLFEVVIGFLLIIFEAVIISIFGTTIGKWILNIKLRMKEDKKIPIRLSFKRSLLSVFKGLGLNIPIINLITMRNSYKKMVAEGEMSWDYENSINVEYGEISVSRKVLIGVIIGIFIVLMIFGIFAMARK